MKLITEINDRGCHICVSHNARSKGYLRIRVKSKILLGHRYVYSLRYGPIPEGKVIRHKCDNRECINIEHLEIGTQKDNVRDMLERRGPNINWKGGTAKGSQIHTSKLTEADVIKIKELLQRKGSSRPTQASIGRMFGMDRSAIYRIKVGKNWGWLELP